MRNPIQKFNQSSIVFEKPGFLSEKLKTLTSSNYHRVQIFFAETSQTFPTYQCLQKGDRDYFYFLQILSYLQKIKRPRFYTLGITQDLNKIKKNLEHPFVEIAKQETCAKFQQKILNIVVVGARQSFRFFRQIAWFLGNNRALSKFRYRILYNVISITKLQKNHSIKFNFNLTTRATLTSAKTADFLNR